MTDETKLEKFFEGRDASYALFRKLRSEIGKICSPEIKVSKTQISFGEELKYIWVWLPQTWIAKRPDTSLTLTILTGEEVTYKRIAESVQPKKGYWTHHILLNKEEDIDAEIHKLLKASYEFYLERMRRKEVKKARTKNQS